MVLNNKQNEEIEPMLDDSIETQKNVEDEEFDDVDLTFPLSIDAEDSREITLDDAINNRMHHQNTKWPNDIYREFMEIVMKYQLSNSCGDRIIKLIDKSRRAPDENRLPKSTKEGSADNGTGQCPWTGRPGLSRPWT